jgi:integrase/recombinase XerD
VLAYYVQQGSEAFSKNLLSRCIGYFIDWCHDRVLDNPADITRPILERYQRALYQYRKQNGDPLTFRTQNQRLRAIKSWFGWLARQNYILHNPASELILPRLENRLPKYILAEGAEVVMQQPDITTPAGLCDRAILETFLRHDHAAHGSSQSQAVRP